MKHNRLTQQYRPYSNNYYTQQSSSPPPPRAHNEIKDAKMAIFIIRGDQCIDGPILVEPFGPKHLKMQKKYRHEELYGVLIFNKNEVERLSQLKIPFREPEKKIPAALKGKTTN